jgi:WD40 repeat protein
VSCIAYSEDWITTGGTDTTTNIWEIKTMKSPLHSVTSCRDEIISCAISQNFGMVASAARDGSILLILTATGTISHVIDLPETPLLICMTNGWGFVLVHSAKIVDAISEYYLTLFTVNGDLIRKVKIEFGIQTWVTWESLQGFDYVAAVANNGEIYVFEVFFLDVGSYVRKVIGQVVAIRYFVEEELLFVVTEGQCSIFDAGQLKIEAREKFVFQKSD